MFQRFSETNIVRNLSRTGICFREFGRETDGVAQNEVRPVEVPFEDQETPIRPGFENILQNLVKAVQKTSSHALGVACNSCIRIVIVRRL